MEQEDRNLLCDYCGTLFARLERAASPPATPAAGPTDREPVPAAEPRLIVYAPRAERAASWVRERLFAVTPSPPRAVAGRAALLALLTLWGLRLMTTSIESNGVGESFLHLVNLPFHEAGHVFFAPFGDFVRTLGGSLGQLIMPMVCCLVLLLKTRDPFGAGVALWWSGENFLDLAPYIDDDGTGELPLLGGNTGESTPYGFHDWEYLMTETGRLGHEHELARASQVLGSLIMIVALAWMAFTLFRVWRLGRSTASPQTLRRAA
jgi:hypothetical protein